MRKKTAALTALVLVLALVLAGCGGEKEPFDPDKTAQAALASGGFSEKLEGMEEAVYHSYLGLEGVEVTAGAVYGSTGSTAEELVVLELADEDNAQAAEAVLRSHLEYLKESNVDYRPDEMPKLDKAVLERRGNTVLLAVAADYQALEAALD